MEKKIDLLLNLPLPIFIDSNGGRSDVAYDISKKIYRKNKSLFIIDECTSACAEYFIPAASKVYVAKDALIGFHNNAFFQGAFKNKPSFSRLPWCGDEKKIWLQKLYREKGLNIDFYKNTIDKLEYSDPEYSVYYEKNKPCVGSIYYSKHSTWYPTSFQLEQLLGLRIGHKICADRKSCWKKKIDNWSPPHTSYVVGDDTYIFSR